MRLASQEKKEGGRGGGGGESAATEAAAATTTETAAATTTTEVPLLQPPRATPYSGKDRGVLLTLGTTQFGHLPLGLLDEGREKPAPAL